MARLAAALITLAVHAVQAAPGDVVQPKVVLPGEWMTDHAEKFLFLPLTVPNTLGLDQCKVMTNGDSLLVVVTESPKDEPETNAVKKYKLVVEAIKKEAGSDEKMLKDKLQVWLDTEDDDEVRVQVRAALDSLKKVREAKQNTHPRTVTVPLGMLAKQAAAILNEGHLLPNPTSFLAKASLHGAGEPGEKFEQPQAAEAEEAEHVLTSLHHVKDKKSGNELHAAIIKESFAIEIPYPVPTGKVFLLKTKADTLMVSMPLIRESLAASGISTGGKPFERVPVFGMAGDKLAGPKEAHLPTLSVGLHVPSVANPSSLKPLA